MSDAALYITPDQLAARLGVSLAAVRKWKVRGTGPAFYKFGGALRYRLEDVERWEAACRVRPARGAGRGVESTRAVFSTR